MGKTFFSFLILAACSEPVTEVKEDLTVPNYATVANTVSLTGGTLHNTEMPDAFLFCDVYTNLCYYCDVYTNECMPIPNNDVGCQPAPSDDCANTPNGCANPNP